MRYGLIINVNAQLNLEKTQEEYVTPLVEFSKKESMASVNALMDIIKEYMALVFQLNAQMGFSGILEGDSANQFVEAIIK